MLFQKRRFSGAVAVVFMAVFLMFSLTGLSVSASDIEYYASWEDYVAGGEPSATWNDKANAIDDVLEASYRLYVSGNQDEAYIAVRNTYNFYYETSGFERNVNGYSGSEVSKAELQFKTARKAVKNGADEAEIASEFNELSEILHIQANHLDGIGDTGSSGLNLTGEPEAEPEPAVDNPDAVEVSDSPAEETQATEAVPPANSGRSNAMVTFWACFGIILREGLEAILVVGAIIAYLVKSGNKDKLKFVYAGSVLAIGASFVCAWLLSLLKLANTANQEIIEGVTALTAVLVLFYVSNWMVSKAESDAWNQYIDNQVKMSAETGSMFTLAFTAFLAVFREGAEVILFYQPLLADASSVSWVWAGFGAGCVVLVFVFLAIRFFSIKIPLRPFFLGTSILMFVMSISFLGSGIKELIEGDVIDMTSPDWLQSLIPFNDVLDVLGIYPCYETLIPQLILLMITLMIFVMQGWKKANNKDSRKTAGVLAIVMGGLGIHQFYLGRYGKGLLCVAFCWTGIPLFIGIAEGIHYLTQTDEEFTAELAWKPQKKKANEKAPVKA